MFLSLNIFVFKMTNLSDQELEELAHLVSENCIHGVGGVDTQFELSPENRQGDYIQIMTSYMKSVQLLYVILIMCGVQISDLRNKKIPLFAINQHGLRSHIETWLDSTIESHINIETYSPEKRREVKNQIMREIDSLPLVPRIEV
jgi:hypothetical protein